MVQLMLGPDLARLPHSRSAPERSITVNKQDVVDTTVLEALGVSRAADRVQMLLGEQVNIEGGTFAENGVEEGATISVVEDREMLKRVSFSQYENDDEEYDEEARVSGTPRLCGDHVVLVGNADCKSEFEVDDLAEQLASSPDLIAVSAAPALSICGEIVNLEVMNNLNGEEDEIVVIGACLMEESGQFSVDNCVLWASQTSKHRHEDDRSLVVIGKGISATGRTVRYDMPQEKRGDDEDPPPCPGLNVRPHYATQLRLNSRRELLFKLDSQAGEPEMTEAMGWVNVTPEGGLREGVSELHLVAGCYNC